MDAVNLGSMMLSWMLLLRQATGVEDTDTSSFITLAASEGPPRHLGPVVPVSLQDIQANGNVDDEWAAWYLQGIIFYDEKLE